ncbi:MAG: hypothetical protein HYY51_02555 [Candidatus Magasanikbacteria bacterium]|nr:hypothetical protein [Candidatus Magasanikbacteria bacterium]
MGTLIEFNDTLQLTAEQGFPEDILNLGKHNQKAVELDEIKNLVFEFKKNGIRLFHHAPTRCFLVHNKNGKWIYWGHIVVTEQNVSGDNKNNYQTTGKYKITKIYSPESQAEITSREARDGESFFDA